MAITVPDVGATACLDALLDEGVTTWYHLYVNDVSLGRATTLGDLTEADWPDYAPQRVTTWTPATVPIDRAVSAADPLLWTRGDGGDPRQVYGYYVTDGQTGPLLWAETRPQGPLPMVAPTDAVLVTPRVTLRQDPEPE